MHYYPEGSFFHMVRADDTLLMIAKRYGIGIFALVASNPGINPDKLYVGQVLCIPPDFEKKIKT